MSELAKADYKIGSIPEGASKRVCLNRLSDVLYSAKEYEKYKRFMEDDSCPHVVKYADYVFTLLVEDFERNCIKD
jgi:hypothetical protein